MWRDFTAAVEEFATGCSGRVECDEAFEVLGEVMPGSMGARRIMLASGRRGYAKPAANVPDWHREVAREKIAADLGFALGLPTSAVLISRHVVNTQYNLAPIVAISFPTFVAGALVKDMEPPISDEEKEKLRPILSAIYVFHTWINDRDHRWGWNHWFERRPNNQIRTAYFDYGQSLNYQWQPPADAPQQQWAPAVSSFAPLDGPLDPVSTPTVIERIQRLCAKELHGILQRIPDDCMAVDDRQNLSRGLEQRANELFNLLMLDEH